MLPAMVPVMGQPTISIVVTAYNDAESIPSLADEIATCMNAAGLAWEAIWIDDGSTDGTLACLQALRSPHRYLSFDRNHGQSAGYRAGAEAAQGEWMATLDGDGQNDPADIPRLLAEVHKRGVGCMVGIRHHRQDPWMRRCSAAFANRLRNCLTGVRVTDAGCATRVFRRELFLRIPFFHGNYYYIPSFLALQGGAFAEMPVNHRPRRSGTSHYGITNRLWSGMNDLMGACWLMRRHRRWTIRTESNPQGRS